MEEQNSMEEYQKIFCSICDKNISSQYYYPIHLKTHLKKETDPQLILKIHDLLNNFIDSDKQQYKRKCTYCEKRISDYYFETHEQKCFRNRNSVVCMNSLINEIMQDKNKLIMVINDLLPFIKEDSECTELLISNLIYPPEDPDLDSIIVNNIEQIDEEVIYDYLESNITLYQQFLETRYPNYFESLMIGMFKYYYCRPNETPQNCCIFINNGKLNKDFWIFSNGRWRKIGKIGKLIDVYEAFYHLLIENISMVANNKQNPADYIADKRELLYIFNKINHIDKGTNLCLGRQMAVKFHCIATDYKAQIESVWSATNK